MHLVESFSLSTGLKIDKPYIYDSYMPLPISAEKYISFQPWGKTEVDARVYPYWGEVLNILRPYLNETNTPVIQIGSKNEPPVQGAVSLLGKTNLNQAAYIIKNSALHLGVDSFGVHMASGFGKKIVALYSNMLPSQCGPYFSDKEDAICLSSLEEGEKASYVYHEDPKTIKRIKPEDIAKAVLKLLGVEYKYEFKTLHMGEEYEFQRVEIIPDNFVQNWKDFELDSAIMRMDKSFNEQMLINQLQICPCSIVTRSQINIDIIKAFKEKIVELIFYIDESTDTDYVQQLKSTGAKLYLLCDLEEKDFNKIKLNYLDLASIIHRPKITKEEALKKIGRDSAEGLYFKSGTSIVTASGLFSDFAHAKLGKNNINNHRFMEPLPIVDLPEFWEDSDRMMFLEKTS